MSSNYLRYYIVNIFEICIRIFSAISLFKLKKRCFSMAYFPCLFFIIEEIKNKLLFPRFSKIGIISFYYLFLPFYSSWFYLSLSFSSSFYLLFLSDYLLSSSLPLNKNLVAALNFKFNSTSLSDWSLTSNNALICFTDGLSEQKFLKFSYNSSAY